MITIITPTYNREKLLSNVYQSLKKQTSKNFEWLVIDDGSSDETEKLLKKIISEKVINVRYYKKENGGKHTALNFSFDKINGEYAVILDSDDIFTEDAIEKMEYYIQKYFGVDKIAALSFRRGSSKERTIGKNFKQKEIISNNIDFRYNKSYPGDMCEVFKTNILTKYRFPVFEGERFISECIVWNEMALNYDTVYIDEIVCICEYLAEGLSNNWFKLVVNNPLGARANNLLFMSKKFKFKIRLKNCIMFDVFSIIARKPIIKETKMKFFSILFYIPSFVGAKILEYKFKKK